jgi:hypothetical protein
MGGAVSQGAVLNLNSPAIGIKFAELRAAVVLSLAARGAAEDV